MFEKYCDVEKNPDIPLCGHNYKIDVNGTIVNKDGLVIPQSVDLNGNPTVHLNLWDGYREYKVAFIVAVCFNKTNVPMYMWRQLDIMFADNNNKNIHPSNLVWKFPVGGLVNLKYPEFAYIPCLTRYAVSKEGIVINCFTGKIIKPFDDKGYYKFRLMLDCGGISYMIGRHRLICLAWLEYPNYVDTLVINHIDGIKGRDIIDNLEWCTRFHNNKHAHDTGLHVNGEILMKNCETNEILEFKSAGKCARYLGLNKATIVYRVRAKEINLYPGNYQFQYKYNLKPWPIVENLTSKELNAGHPVKVKTRHIKNGDIKIHDSVVACARYIKSSISIIHVYLTDEVRNKTPVLEYDIKYLEDDTNWPIRTEEEINRLLIPKNERVRSFTLIDTITSKEYFFPNILEVIKFTNRGENLILHAIRNDRLISRRYKVKK